MKTNSISLQGVINCEPLDTEQSINWNKLDYDASILEEITPLPRLSLRVLDPTESVEYDLLDLAKEYNLAIPHIGRDYIDFAKLDDLIDQYETLVLDDENRFFFEQAKSFHLPIKDYHLNDITILIFELEDYEALLEKASQWGINWDRSVYDLEGLENAIIEAQQDNEEEYFCQKNSLMRTFQTNLL